MGTRLPYVQRSSAVTLFSVPASRSSKGRVRDGDLRQPNAFAGPHIKRVAQPRQIEGEEMEGAVRLKHQRSLDQMRGACR
jgi:hypothetical protein